jgi:uncharacterized membrane protein YhaH (DUF805 family)
MSFSDAVTTVLTKKYADFSGRARRSEYWWFALALSLAWLAVIIVLGVIIQSMALYYTVAVLLWAAAIVPSLGVLVRRLHDTGRSGWWFFISFVPLVGGIILLVFTVSDGTPGDNQYGPSPKAIAAPYGA